MSGPLRLPLAATLRRYLHNTVWLMAERLVRMAVAVVVVALLARYLGTAQFGALNYAAALVSVGAMIATLGLNRIAVRELVHQPEATAEIVGTVFGLRLVAGLVLAALLVAAAWVLDAGARDMPLLVAVLGVGLVFQACAAAELWFNAQVKAKFPVGVKTVVFVIAALIKLLLIVLHAPLLAFVITAAAEVALTAVGIAYVYQRCGQAVAAWRFQLQRARTLLAESWPEIIAGLGILLCMRMDQIMLGSWSGAAGVGVYSAATYISEAWYFVPAAIVSSIFPAVVRMRKRSQPLYHQRLQQLLTLLCLVSLFIAAPLILVAHWLVHLLYGSAYAAAGDVLMIHAATLPAVALGLGSGAWIIAEGLTRLGLYRALLGLAINFVLNLLLIPRYGGIGAAWATLASLYTAYLFSDILYVRTRLLWRLKIRALLLLDVRRLWRYLRGTAQESGAA